MFSLYPVDSRSAEALEPLGQAKKNFWYHDDQRLMLFKPEERGTGEDWAEKISCHLCELLGLPHVQYELAELFDGGQYIQPGVICETCSPAPSSLVLGNQLLLARDPKYPSDDSLKYKVREHTVQSVAEAVMELAPPSAAWMLNVPAGIETAIDVFVGYVMLDAWVANQDRHHQNWAALRDDEQLRLAPTFDHGAALARNMPEVERHERLTTKDRNRQTPAFAERASSAFYAAPTDSKPLKTFEAFVAFAKRAPDAGRIWLDRLALISLDEIRQIIDEVPTKRMSRISREFTLSLLSSNKERLRKEQVNG